MKDDTTQYDKRLLEYRDKLLQRNKEIAEDDDLDQIIGIQGDADGSAGSGSYTAKKNFETQQTPVSDSYRAYADELESVLLEVGANQKKNDTEIFGKTEKLNKKEKPQKTGKVKEVEVQTKRHLPDQPDIQKTRGAKVPAVLQIWSMVAILLLIVFIGVTIAYVSANARYKYNQMDIRQIDESEIAVNDGIKALTEGYTTIALYGVDSRESNLNAGTNSDAIIIVSINNDTKETKLVSVYRDTIVKIQNDAGITNKVNYAYQLGGALMSINTLNVNFDLYITDYITVDFNAMADIINALGGVEVDIKEEEINNLNKNLAEQIGLSGVYSDGVHDSGVQILNGQQAVAYSRIRSTANGDITRTERQRNVLMGLFSRAMNADETIIDNLIDVSFEGISTSFTKEDIVGMVKDLSDYNITGNVGFPFSYSFASIDGKGSIIAASDMAANVSALHEYLYGEAGYVPSSMVDDISSEIASETGVSAATVTVPDSNAGGISSDDLTDSTSDGNVDEDNQKTDESSDYNTITAPPEGMIENE